MEVFENWISIWTWDRKKIDYRQKKSETNQNFENLRRNYKTESHLRNLHFGNISFFSSFNDEFIREYSCLTFEYVYGFYFFVIRPQKRLMRIRQGVKNSPLGVKFSYGVKNRKNYGLYPRELIIRFLKVNPKSQIVFSLIWIIVFKKFYDSSNFWTKIFNENFQRSIFTWCYESEKN